MHGKYSIRLAAPDHPGRLILVGRIVGAIVQINIDIRQGVVDAGRGHPPGVGRRRAHPGPAVAGAINGLGQRING